MALGALGEVVTAADAIEHEGDGGGLEAFGLALALAPIAPAERVERLDDARQLISAGLNDRLATMIERAESGYSVSIVM